MSKLFIEIAMYVLHMHTDTYCTPSPIGEIFVPDVCYLLLFPHKIIVQIHFNGDLLECMHVWELLLLACFVS